MDEMPQTFTIPLPAIFDVLPIPIPGRAIHVARAKAAFELGNFAIIRLDGTGRRYPAVCRKCDSAVELPTEDLQNDWVQKRPHY